MIAALVNASAEVILWLYVAASFAVACGAVAAVLWDEFHDQ